MKQTIFYIYIIFIFSGCTYTTYQHVDPATYTGKKCVKECRNIKYTCQEIRYTQNRYHEKKYQQNIEIYNQCQNYLNIKNQKKRYQKKKKKYIKQCMRYNNIKNCEKKYNSFTSLKQKCHKPTRYYSNKECSSNYNSCFRGCGGKIIAVDKEMF